MKKTLAGSVRNNILDITARGRCESMLERYGMYLRDIRSSGLTDLSYSALAAVDIKHAIHRGDIDTVKSYVEHGFNSNVLVAMFEEEITLAEYARIWGRSGIAIYLEERTKGAPVARLSDNEGRHGISNIRYDTSAVSVRVTISFGRCTVTEHPLMLQASDDEFTDPSDNQRVQA